MRYSTQDYRDAMSGEGPLAATWKDKPHRLVYDLCNRIESIAAAIGCHAGKDGSHWNNCPQLRDGEPEKTGRHCPLDNPSNDPDYHGA